MTSTTRIHLALVHSLVFNPHFLAFIPSAPQKSLGEEVNELTSSRLLKLEKDNQTLMKTVEELREAASHDTVTKLSKVNLENQRLNQKVSERLSTILKCFRISVKYPFPHPGHHQD